MRGLTEAMMNQPEERLTRQDKINRVAVSLHQATGKSYNEIADVLDERADDPQIQAMAAKPAKVDDVTADELRAAASWAREYAARQGE